MQRPRIVVVGSLNVDSTFRVPRIPAPGETLTASGMLTCFGGKGANQAVAAARAGGHVSLIGCIGSDDPGRRYLEHLAAEQIDTAGIVRRDAATGSAMIAVDDQGENCIIVNPGANHALTVGQIEQQAQRIQEAEVLLLQLECPLDVVKRAAELARTAGVPIVLNPSPWQDAVRRGAIPVDLLIVNAREAVQLTGQSIQALRADPQATVARCGGAALVITQGAAATLVLSEEGVFELTPPPVVPVDTVGAGDTFAGAFSVAKAEGCSLREATEFANAAAAMATLQPGAQTAMPRRDEIASFLSGQRPAHRA